MTGILDGPNDLNLSKRAMFEKVIEIDNNSNNSKNKGKHCLKRKC